MTPAIQAIDPSRRRRANIPPNPWRLISVLGLDSAREISDFTDRAQAFRSIQMGLKDVTIGQLLDLITSDSGGLCPPSAGDLCDRGGAASRHAAAMDVNRAICANGYGYPLLDCVSPGDAPAPELAARPGNGGYPQASVRAASIGHNSRSPMRLYAWNGTALAAISPSAPRFAPFVLADIDGELRSLTEIHQLRILPISGSSFGPLTLQGVIADNEEAVRPMLEALIEQAARSNDPQRGLCDLISHGVALDGSLTRLALQPDGKGFKLGDQRYASARALIDHALVPLHAATQPHRYFAAIGDLPPLLPVISDPLMQVLSMVLTTHYPQMPAGCASVTEPFNPHLVWRDDDLAGHMAVDLDDDLDDDMPRRNGTQREDRKLGAMTRIASVLLSQFRDINPISSIALPARIFMLWPAGTHKSDADALSELFRLVRPISNGSDDAGQRVMQQAVNLTVSEWLGAHTGALSPYFLDRFAETCGTFIPSDAPAANEPILPQAGDPVEPEGFRDLTLRQASMIVSALQAISNRSQKNIGCQPIRLHHGSNQADGCFGAGNKPLAGKRLGQASAYLARG